MPGLYKDKDFDFAGFCVGAVKSLLPKKNTMKENDLLYGIKSSGFHSNGYSLIRKIIANNINLKSSTDFKSKYHTTAEALMSPTVLYYPYLKIF